MSCSGRLAVAGAGDSAAWQQDRGDRVAGAEGLLTGRLTLPTPGEGGGSCATLRVTFMPVQRPHRLLRLAIASIVAICAGALLAGSALAAPTESTKKRPGKRPPVKSVEIGVFGDVLTTKRNRALYYWTPEKRRKGKIFCTGACEAAWPALTVKKGVKFRKRIKGIPGKFGTIRRPDGKRQVTHRGLPLYTYAHERRRQVLCDNVNGWFVIRVAKRQTSTAFTGPFT
jgi:predicted lipoprotein with Yx(FWY)xxD motif